MVEPKDSAYGIDSTSIMTRTAGLLKASAEGIHSGWTSGKPNRSELKIRSGCIMGKINPGVPHVSLDGVVYPIDFSFEKGVSAAVKQ